MGLSKMTRPSRGEVAQTMSINGYNHHRHHFHHLVSRRISPSQLFAPAVGPRRSMAMAAADAAAPSSAGTGGGSGRRGGAYTTIRERVAFEREVKKSKFIAIAGPVSDEQSAFSFLSQVRDPRATHNCWAYKVGDQFRSNDDGEPSGTAGKPIYSAIESSGIDRVMVVVIRHFGGIKLGTGGLVRAYGGVASECLKNAPTCLVKSKVPMGVEIPYELLGVLYHQLQAFHAEDIKQDYETGKDVTTMVTFKVDYDRMEKLEEAIKAHCGRDVPLYKS